MRNIIIHICLLLHHFFIFSGCTGKSEQDAGNLTYRANALFPYDLQAPNRKIILPSKLEEISGIAYIDEYTLACIQDEKGSLFIYSLTEEKIIREDKFGKGGDYEDIAIVKNDVFVVRSDGQLWKMPLKVAEKGVKLYHTPLSAKNDVEGLGYDAANNRLLLACKGSSGIKKNIPGIKAVYAFDLDENRLIEEPVFSIKTEEIKQKLPGNDYKDFRPSGIAVHPITGEIYVLASVGKVLVVLDKNGIIQEVHTLTTADFKQPEGICFSPDGNLFISNEGKGGRATILQFNYAKQ